VTCQTRFVADLPSLGMGCATLGNLYKPMSDAAAAATVHEAISNGLNFFDTAPYYGFGLSERRRGDALRQCGHDDIIVSTKVGRVLTPNHALISRSPRDGFHAPLPFEARFDYTYDGVMRSYEDSLQRLGLSYRDVVLVHDIGVETHGLASPGHFRDLMSSGYRALDELRNSGAVKAIA